MPTVRVSHVSKRFGAIQALDDVSLSLASGEVRALVGANGSGKSTLVKIFAGYHPPDTGTLTVGDVTCDLADGRRVGQLWRVGAVHQDLGLIEGLTVAENFLLPELSASRSLKLSWTRLRAEVVPYLERFSVDVPLLRKVEECPRVAQALLALARAVWVLEGGATPGGARDEDTQLEDTSGGTAATLILDEITAFLSVEEVNMLRGVVRRVAEHGHSVLFVSHDLDEILTFTDELSVLRDGHVVAERQAEETDKKELFDLIAGRLAQDATESDGRLVADRQQNQQNQQNQQKEQRPTIAVSGLTAGSGGVGPIDFGLVPGEILGLTGLVGSGYDLVPYALFGADRSATGELRLTGGTVRLDRLSPQDAISLGIALVPGDRGTQGLWKDLTIGENLSVIDRELAQHPWALSWRALWQRGDQTVLDYAIKAPSARSKIAELSGGNAQRVLLAKWLALEPSLFLLHEPVRGVDVGARSRISELVLRRAEQGLGVICASGDHEFLAQVCHRVLVFAGGGIVDELQAPPGSEFVPKEEIVWACQAKRQPL